VEDLSCSCFYRQAEISSGDIKRRYQAEISGGDIRRINEEDQKDKAEDDKG
jgi:hypothetical protein